MVGTLQAEVLSRNYELNQANINWTRTTEVISYPEIQKDFLSGTYATSPVELADTILGVVGAAVIFIGGLTVYRTYRKSETPVVDARPLEPTLYSPSSSSLSAGSADGAYEGENQNSAATIFWYHLVWPKCDRVSVAYKTHWEPWSIFAAPLLILLLFALNLLLFETLHTTWETARYTQSLFPTGRGKYLPLIIVYNRVWRRGLLAFNTRILLCVAGFLSAAFTWYISLSGFLIDFLPFFRWFFRLFVVGVVLLWTVLQNLDNENRSEGGVSGTRAALYVIEAVYLLLFVCLIWVTRKLAVPFRASNYEEHVMSQRGKPNDDTDRLLNEPTALHVDWQRALPAVGTWNCISRLEAKAQSLRTYAKSTRATISVVCASCMAISVVFYIISSIYKRELDHDPEIWYPDSAKVQPWNQPWTNAPRTPDTFYEVYWIDEDGNPILPIPGFPPEHTIARFVLIAVTYVVVVLTMFVPIRGMTNIMIACLLHAFVLIPPWVFLTRRDFQLIVAANEAWCWSDELDELDTARKIAVWATAQVFVSSGDTPIEVKPECVNLPYVGIAIMTLLIPLLILLFVGIELYRSYGGECRYHMMQQKYSPDSGEPRTLHMGQNPAHTHSCKFRIVECGSCKRKLLLHDNDIHYPLNCGGPGERVRHNVQRVKGRNELVPLEINVLVTSSILLRTFVDFTRGGWDDHLEEIELKLISLVQTDIDNMFPDLNMVVSFASIINLDEAMRQSLARSNNPRKHVHKARTAAIVTLVPPTDDYILGTMEPQIIQRQPRTSASNTCYHYWTPTGRHWFEWDSHKRICCDGILDKHMYQLAMDVLVITNYQDPNCWKQPIDRVLHRAFTHKHEQLVSLSQMAEPLRDEVPGPMGTYKHRSHPGEFDWSLSMLSVYRSVGEVFHHGERQHVLFGERLKYLQVVDDLPVLREFVKHTPHFNAILETLWELLKLPPSLPPPEFITLMFIVAHAYEQSVIADHLQIVHMYINISIIRKLRYLYDNFQNKLMDEKEKQQLESEMCQILHGTALRVRPMRPLTELKFGQPRRVAYKLWGFWHMMLHIEVTNDQFLLFKEALPWGSFDGVAMYLFRSFSSRPAFMQVYDVEKLLVACGMSTDLTRALFAELNPTEFGIAFRDFYRYFELLVYGRLATTKVQQRLLREVTKRLKWRNPRLSHQFTWWKIALEWSSVILFWLQIILLIWQLIDDDTCKLSNWDRAFKVLMLLVAFMVFVWKDFVGLLGSSAGFVGGVAESYGIQLPKVFHRVRRMDLTQKRYDTASKFKRLENDFLDEIQQRGDTISRALILRALAVSGSPGYQLPVTAYFHRDEPLIAGAIALIFFWEIPLMAIALFEVYVEICDLGDELASFALAALAFVVSFLSLMESGVTAHSSRSITTMARHQTQRAQGGSVYEHLGEYVPPPCLDVFEKDRAGTPIMTEKYWKDKHYNLSELNEKFDDMMEMKGQISIVDRAPIQRNEILRDIQERLRGKNSPPLDWVGPYDHNRGTDYRPFPRYQEISDIMYYYGNPANTWQRGGSLAPHQRNGQVQYPTWEGDGKLTRHKGGFVPLRIGQPKANGQGDKGDFVPLFEGNHHPVNSPHTPHPTIMQLGPTAPPPSPEPNDATCQSGSDLWKLE